MLHALLERHVIEAYRFDLGKHRLYVLFDIPVVVVRAVRIIVVRVVELHVGLYLLIDG